ncbi:hypothetical protein EHS25_007231 [Saitozyma podzolica]|uniref:Heat shock factor-binding protein 1 n=1 Tax=Saitozyma podzolica TaxID=1890683 RepID=A0A427XMP1_9TREE|nr:hypothetical protein EHS25_007231 [Saitozyma podzolica]
MSSGLSTAALAPAAPSTKRLSTIAKASGSGGSAVASPAGKGKGPANGGAGLAKDVVSPGELCGFVDTLLSQLETRFDEMSEQVLGRMNDMSTRIDGLENAIQDLMHGGSTRERPSRPV